ncbi:MAG: hypothetical protein KDI36_15485 [Pseudomonadales bacterium]|nr:hypothetical protein [Pseudomonadales bacterium]
MTVQGTLLVFVEGEPVDYHGNIHFGFRCDSRRDVEDWAQRFGVDLEAEGNYCGFRTRDPEGNLFEVYWEQS